MAKVSLFIVITSLLAGCWITPDIKNDGYWNVVNHTDQSLRLTYSPYNKDFDIQEVAPGDSISVAGWGYYPSIEPYFNYWLEQINTFGRDTSFIVLSESGNLLKEWKYSERDSTGKQFYKESSWNYYRYQRGVYVRATWTFEIESDDLSVFCLYLPPQKE